MTLAPNSFRSHQNDRSGHKMKLKNAPKNDSSGAMMNFSNCISRDFTRFVKLSLAGAVAFAMPGAAPSKTPVGAMVLVTRRTGRAGARVAVMLRLALTAQCACVRCGVATLEDKLVRFSLAVGDGKCVL